MKLKHSEKVYDHGAFTIPKHLYKISQ